jgi:HD superfamily phosphodiesterase
MQKDNLAQIKELIQPYILSVKDAQHGVEHIQNVRKNASDIADLVDPGRERIDREVLDICALSHDIAYSKHKLSFLFWIFEGYLAAKILKKILVEPDLSDETRNIILDSVKRHTHSFPIRLLNKRASIYSQILQDADTLDLFNKDRVEAFLQTHSLKLPKRLLTFLAGFFDKRIGFFLNLDESRSYIFQRKYFNLSEDSADLV